MRSELTSPSSIYKKMDLSYEKVTNVRLINSKQVERQNMNRTTLSVKKTGISRDGSANSTHTVQRQAIGRSQEKISTSADRFSQAGYVLNQIKNEQKLLQELKEGKAHQAYKTQREVEQKGKKTLICSPPFVNGKRNSNFVDPSQQSSSNLITPLRSPQAKINRLQTQFNHLDEKKTFDGRREKDYDPEFHWQTTNRSMHRSPDAAKIKEENMSQERAQLAS